MEIRCAQLLCTWQIAENSALGGERYRGRRHRSGPRRKLVDLETGERRGAIWGSLKFEENSQIQCVVSCTLAVDSLG